jgi:hypothetical protein
MPRNEEVNSQPKATTEENIHLMKPYADNGNDTEVCGRTQIQEEGPDGGYGWIVVFCTLMVNLIGGFAEFTAYFTSIYWSISEKVIRLRPGLEVSVLP